MANSIKLEVITPERLFYEGEIELVIVRTLEGDEGFMANHTWACKLLDVGELWIQEAGQSDFKIAAISGGYVDVQEQIVIFTDAAEWPEEIDTARAERARAEAENRLKNRTSADLDIEVERLNMMKSLNRLNVKSGGIRRRKG